MISISRKHALPSRDSVLRVGARGCGIAKSSAWEIISRRSSVSKEAGLVTVHPMRYPDSAYQLAMNVRWRCRYVETHRNASDADRRLADRGLIGLGELLSGRRLIARLAARGATADVERLRCHPRVGIRPTVDRPSSSIRVFYDCSLSILCDSTRGSQTNPCASDVG